MKRIIVLIPGLVLLMLFAVAPTMAASAKVPVHGGSISGGTSISPEMWLTNGNITQLRGGGSQGGQLGLYIYPSTEEPDYVLTIKEEYDAIVNWKTGEGVWRFTETWEYLLDGQIVGTFKGEWLIKSTGAYITPSGYPVAWTYLEGHAVLQGDGIFDGQTLIMDSERTRGFPGAFEGFLLTS